MVVVRLHTAAVDGPERVVLNPDILHPRESRGAGLNAKVDRRPTNMHRVEDVPGDRHPGHRADRSSRAHQPVNAAGRIAGVPEVPGECAVLDGQIGVVVTVRAVE